MLKLAGYTPEEAEALIEETKEYLRDTRNHPTTCL